MTSILLTAPAIEPVSLAEAKAYLRVEHSDDDELIGALIAGSRVHVEAQAQKHVTHNEALVLLDALVQLTVESRA